MSKLPPSLAPAVLTYVEAAHYVGLPTVGALRTIVCRKRGPPSISYGLRDRRFRVVDLDMWLAEKSRSARAREEALGVRQPAEKRRRGRPTKAETIARRRNAIVEPGAA